MREHRLRRSLLITPGNRPERMAKALTLPADAVVLDLEDGVPPDAKDDARRHVAELIRQAAPGGRELCVRVNAPGTDALAADLASLPLDRVTTLMVPKVERPEEVAALSRRLGDQHDLILSIETPRGLLNALSIAGASATVSALFFGSGDYTAATGARPTETALLMPRSLIAAAAGSCGLQALDAAFFARVTDVEATRADAAHARELGFAGKLVFHPVQIAVVNDVFSPSRDEVGWAERVRAAHGEALRNGHGTAMVDGTFVAIDIVIAADRVLRTARAVAAREQT